ncbi:MAG TPA: hypothetical protein VGP47_08895 [Parachlamydiaceae bacterium]|nr:hypothetical protein [Parachlamydiaceae bacterium]
MNNISAKQSLIDNQLIWEERKGPIPENMSLRIIAKINNLDAWNQLEAVKFGTTIQTSQREWIVTASITRSQLKTLCDQPFVITIELGRKIGLV